jgi:hypothetical protein
LWDGPGPLAGDPVDPRCLRTVHRGTILHDTL